MQNWTLFLFILSSFVGIAQEEPKPMYSCSVCGENYDELPVLATNSPAELIVPMEEFATRVEEDSDICVIDNTQFFIRAHLELPIKGSKEVFIYSIWVSLSEKSMQDFLASWDSEDREEHGPYMAWFMSSLPDYPQTLHLKARVHLREAGVVPYIELEPTMHPLAVEQREGISPERVHKVLERTMNH